MFKFSELNIGRLDIDNGCSLSSSMGEDSSASPYTLLNLHLEKKKKVSLHRVVKVWIHALRDVVYDQITFPNF